MSLASWAALRNSRPPYPIWPGWASLVLATFDETKVLACRDETRHTEHHVDTRVGNNEFWSSDKFQAKQGITDASLDRPPSSSILSLQIPSSLLSPSRIPQFFMTKMPGKKISQRCQSFDFILQLAKILQTFIPGSGVMRIHLIFVRANGGRYLA